MCRFPVFFLLACLVGGAAVAQDRDFVAPWIDDPSTWRVDSKTAVFLTHFTNRLDKNELTRPAQQKLNAVAKQYEIPVLCLQERHRPTDEYFYPDCEPTACVDSAVGLFEFDTQNIEHAIVAGGYYEMCLNNTVKQLIANWQRARRPRNLRITYVLDAIYCVFSDRVVTDPYDRAIDRWLEKQPTKTVLLSSALAQLDDRKQAASFLSRRWHNVPIDFGLHYGFRDVFQLVRDPKRSSPTLMISYLPVNKLADNLDSIDRARSLSLVAEVSPSVPGRSVSQ